MEKFITISFIQQAFICLEYTLRLHPPQSSFATATAYYVDPSRLPLLYLSAMGSLQYIFQNKKVQRFGNTLNSGYSYKGEWNSFTGWYY